MIGPLAKLIDWSALQLAYAAVRVKHAPKSSWKLDEALEFVNGPDFMPAVIDPAHIKFDGPRQFRFPTPCLGPHAENNLVNGRLYRCTGRWRERPVIMLLDGYPPLGYNTVFPLIARRFNRATLNVATLVAPHNLQRSPRQPVEENCLEFARSMAQNVAEVRALTGWLLGEGCPAVALLGFSFGGWVTGLTACGDARIAAAVMTVPGVSFRTFASSPVVWPRLLQSLQELQPAHEALDTTRLNLTLSVPVIPKENILLIKGMYDLFGNPGIVEELWQKWEKPEIWRLPHGHVSSQIALCLMGSVLHWLAPRLESRN